jgi:carbon storage regulator CsrA
MALILTRRPGQKIILDRPHIEITLESVVGKTARLVIDAPKHVRVIREELIYRTAEAKQK